MRAAKVQARLRIRAVSPEPSLLAHTSSESRGTFREKARSLAPLNGWACAVKICHDGMLEDTNSLDGAHLEFVFCKHISPTIKATLSSFMTGIWLSLTFSRKYDFPDYAAMKGKILWKIYSTYPANPNIQGRGTANKLFKGWPYDPVSIFNTQLSVPCAYSNMSSRHNKVDKDPVVHKEVV